MEDKRVVQKVDIVYCPVVSLIFCFFEKIKKMNTPHCKTTFNPLRSQLVRVKDKTESLKKCGTVYRIHCEQCNKDYVGETSRLLETRVKEHLSRNSSAVHEHCLPTGYLVDSSRTKVPRKVTRSNGGN